MSKVKPEPSTSSVARKVDARFKTLMSKVKQSYKTNKFLLIDVSKL